MQQPWWHVPLMIRLLRALLLRVFAGGSHVWLPTCWLSIVEIGYEMIYVTYLLRCS
jgi:hypothetical protein